MADDIIADARDRYEASVDGSSYNRETAERDIRFARLAEQWEEQDLKQRRAEGRPALTLNRMPAFIRQIVNEARQAKPGIKVSPVDGGADPETAAVISGLIRAIERHSQAGDAYDTAIDHAVTGGFGFFKLGIDYAHRDSFDLEASVIRVPNPLSIYWDTNSRMLDASDWEYALDVDYLTEGEFKARWSKADPVSFEGDDRDAVENSGEELVRVAEYWLRERTKRTILQVRGPDGRIVVVREENLEGFLERLSMELGADASGLFEILREREVDDWKIIRRMISGADVLEEDEWPGSTIPICPVWGDEVIHEGRRYFRSMVADLIWPQRQLNFWRSATTELVALAPRAPYLMPAGALPQKGVERQKWGQVNARSFPYLVYEGNVPPQRQQFAGVPAGAIQEALNAADDMKSITGIYDAALGARSNEQSGRAILARQRESDTSNFHFLDNLNRAIAYAARCLVEIIPSVYGPRQTIRILGEDMAEEVVQLVGQGAQDSGGSMPGVDGEPRLYDLSVGQYDVAVRSGPSYQTQREEAREVLIELIRAQPELAGLLGDLLVTNMDFAGADEVAERMRAMLPPQVQQMMGMAPPQMPGQMPGQMALPAPQGMQGPPQAPQGQPQEVPSAPMPAGAEAMTGTVEPRPVWAV